MREMGDYERELLTKIDRLESALREAKYTLAMACVCPKHEAHYDQCDRCAARAKIDEVLNVR